MADRNKTSSRPTPAQRRDSALLEKARGKTIIVINAWWSPFGNSAVWGTKGGKSTKTTLADDEIRSLRRLGKSGALVEKLVEDGDDGVWRRRVIGTAK